MNNFILAIINDMYFANHHVPKTISCKLFMSWMCYHEVVLNEGYQEKEAMGLIECEKGTIPRDVGTSLAWPPRFVSREVSVSRIIVPQNVGSSMQERTYVCTIWQILLLERNCCLCFTSLSLSLRISSLPLCLSFLYDTSCHGEGQGCPSELYK